MTLDTLDDLRDSVGRKLTNKEWVKIIAENFNVSNSVAKDMLHAMYSVYKIKA